jgi:4-alpha-glucanotransferase
MNAPSPLKDRRSGVVLHFTSLPGPHGSGDLGPPAWRFVDWLAAAGQTVWQVLPVGPAGPGDSPYQSPSAFAGHPLLVALQPLVDSGWLQSEALAGPPPFPAAQVDFAASGAWRLARLRAAAAGFQAQATPADRIDFATWRQAQAGWLPDWTLFAALKDAHGGQPWWLWADALARREPQALQAARQAHAQAIAEHEFMQWCFDRQLAALRAHAKARGVLLMGDLPIFVAHDSADVWARPDLYWLGADHQPTAVAGAPPDGYTPDGQRWGNPLYRWDRMAAEGFAWWLARVRRALTLADIFRIDHFRGFASYWEVPAASATARDGRWVQAPGTALFDAIAAAFAGTGAGGPLPIVAEDLGLITPEVVALRDRYGFPGMRIVYEGLMHGPEHPNHDFLPHRHVPNGLAYSSTHDSDTVAGWWAGATGGQRDFAAAYLGIAGGASPAAAAQAVLRATATSVAGLALAPMQDLLGLGSDQRMNRPGTADGNWGWRFEAGMVGPELAPRLARLAAVTGRAAFG